MSVSKGVPRSRRVRTLVSIDPPGLPSAGRRCQPHAKRGLPKMKLSMKISGWLRSDQRARNRAAWRSAPLIACK